MDVRIGLATAIAAFDRDEDLAPLLAALHARGAAAEVRAWDDPTVSWARFDLVVLRSTWDYMDRLPAFLDWCDRVHAASHLVNPPDVVRWNTDKHYLAELAAAGIPVPECRFLEPAVYAGPAARPIEVDVDPAPRSIEATVDAGPAARSAEADSNAGPASRSIEADIDAMLDAFGECVVKPAVGAGSRGAQRFAAAERDAATAHALALLAEGRSVLLQPYLAAVDQAGETGLVFLGGQFSHAFRKAPLLAPGAAASTALAAPERITARVPQAAELTLAKQVLAALPFRRVPAYARVDLLPSADGPRLLEVELTEPSLYFAHGPDSAERFATVLLDRLAGRAPPATHAPPASSP